MRCVGGGPLRLPPPARCKPVLTHPLFQAKGDVALRTDVAHAGNSALEKVAELFDGAQRRGGFAGMRRGSPLTGVDGSKVFLRSCALSCPATPAKKTNIAPSHAALFTRTSRFMIKLVSHAFPGTARNAPSRRAISIHGAQNGKVPTHSGTRIPRPAAHGRAGPSVDTAPSDRASLEKPGKSCCFLERPFWVYCCPRRCPRHRSILHGKS